MCGIFIISLLFLFPPLRQSNHSNWMQHSTLYLKGTELRGGGLLLSFFSGRAQYVWAETAGKVVGCCTWTRRRWSRLCAANVKKNEREHFAWRPFPPPHLLNTPPFERSDGSGAKSDRALLLRVLSGSQWSADLGRWQGGGGGKSKRVNLDKISF